MPATQTVTVEESNRKLRELILYICREAEGDSAFGSVKLNKILFFSDFEAYLEAGKPITGQEYQKLEQGPCPRIMLSLLETMQQQGELAIRREQYYGHTQKRPLALREPNLSGFTGDEIALVGSKIRRFWGMSATRISELSHEFIGWQLASIGETIPYSLALLENRELTQEELQWGRELEGLAGEFVQQHGYPTL